MQFLMHVFMHCKKIFKYPKNPTLATNEWFFQQAPPPNPAPPIFLEASFSEALNVAHALMFLFTCKNFLCPVAKSCRSLWWSWHLIVLFFVDLISLSYLVFSGQWSVAKIHQSPRDFLFSYFCFSFVSFAFSLFVHLRALRRSVEEL